MSSPSAQNAHHDVGLSAHQMSATFADHLDLDAAHSASVITEGLNSAAVALGAEPTSILDLGAGTGTGTLALARRFPNARVDSLDHSKDLLTRLAASAASAGFATRVHTHQIDLDEDWTGAVPANVDLVWASLSLHHVEDPARVLRQAFTALRPGGAIVVTEMTGASLYEPGDLGSGQAGLAGRLVTALAAEGYPATADWSQQLSAAGFDLGQRHDHTVTVAGDTVEGAQYLVPQLRAWRERLTSGLTAEDRAGLDRAIADLDTGSSQIVQASGRAVWVAVRPTGTPFPTGNGGHVVDATSTSTSVPAGFSARLEAEVVVVGGGAAGLAAAVALARSRRRVIVVDAGEPRNAVAHGAHNLLGNEGISPLEFLARGRAEAEAYGVRFLSGRATGASGTIDDFTIEVDGGDRHVRARRVVLAGGLIDDLPDVPGVREAWGTSVLHCPFCHGWEIRDQRIGILTRDEIAIHHAMLFRQLSDDVTLFLHGAGEPTEEQWDQLAALNVRVVRPRVARLIIEGRQVKAVQIEGGTQFEMDAVVVAPHYNVRTELFEALGGEATPTPFGRQIAADQRGGTAIPGVFAAGNASEPMAMLVASTASGVTTGSAVHGSLAFADLALAVNRRRAPSMATMAPQDTTRF